MTGRRLLSAFIAIAACFQAGFSTPPPKPASVVKMENLSEQLEQAQQRKAEGKPKPVTFEFTETELNDYLKYTAANSPRPGFDSMTLKFFPGNYISSYTIVDFDSVEQWKPGSIPMVLKPVLRGKRAIWVDIRFDVHDAAATYTVEKAYFDKVPLPGIFIRKVIAIIAAKQPEQFDVSKPLPLPMGLSRVWTASKILGGTT